MIVRRSFDAGVTWGESPIVLGTLSDSSSSNGWSVVTGVVSAASGTFVWWLENAGGPPSQADKLSYARASDGVTFEPAKVLNRAENQPSEASFLADGDGVVHAFWKEYSEGLTVRDFSVRHQVFEP